MKRLFLMGRSEAGKTSLTQALRGERLHYHKTQYTYADGDTIDTPGEYSETKAVGVGLACFSFEADVIALLIAANEPFTVFAPNCKSFLNRTLIGVITKINEPNANVAMVRQWLENCGCDRIFLVDSATGEGIGELRAYLEQDVEPMTLEQAKARQREGVFC
ncbi:EutP/PduV family microcompartment system protein [Parafannyhessea umbonata]|uniref:Ethanolamine utilization protein EutP n=1 Tax=Parafannyhessea umbonata TaxID=604330 RepID=A0A1H9R1M8_9ACTN|nr:EutP/PduV family microcompartment system protein [Parafannyhessea umbonata]SER66415.1 ethanolamine utilization protein EutP [Parafannyhessea umbonata]